MWVIQSVPYYEPNIDWCVKIFYYDISEKFFLTNFWENIYGKLQLYKYFKENIFEQFSTQLLKRLKFLYICKQKLYRIKINIRFHKCQVLNKYSFIFFSKAKGTRISKVCFDFLFFPHLNTSKMLSNSNYLIYMLPMCIEDRHFVTKHFFNSLRNIFIHSFSHDPHARPWPNS